MKIYIFGNGNISFEEFEEKYLYVIKSLPINENTYFILGDFRGLDTLMMEYLKNKTKNVIIYHIGKKPRYFPDTYNTYAKDWQIISDFSSDLERDEASIQACTHFLAIDYNSDNNRKSGTLKNIEKCLELNKIQLLN